MSVGRSHFAVISLLILALSLWSSVTDSLSSRLRQRALSSSNNEKDTSHATRTQERFYRINEGWLKELIGKENNKNNPACHCVRTFLWLFLSLSFSLYLYLSPFLSSCLFLFRLSFSASLTLSSPLSLLISHFLLLYFFLSLSLLLLFCLLHFFVIYILRFSEFSLLRLHFSRAILSLIRILTYIRGRY